MAQYVGECYWSAVNRVHNEWFVIIKLLTVDHFSLVSNVLSR